MSARLLIAVDGPAASGKGTLAARLAAHFGLPHLDTGLLYRAVGKKWLDLKQQGSDLPDDTLAISVARALSASDLADPTLTSETVAGAASIISAIPEVRAALLDYQRQFAAQVTGAVLDGRDIGTVICPDAPYKFFITASAEVRAERRYKQQAHLPNAASFETILTAIRDRDARDTARTAAPLLAAPDAITIDSSTMTADAVFEAALKNIE